MKLKKQQRENERCKKIERDNFILLQKMNYITRTSRVDNEWKTPQPTFLNRVAIYNTTVPKIEDIELVIEDVSEEEQPQSRKSKCIACNTHKTDGLKVCLISGIENKFSIKGLPFI